MHDYQTIKIANLLSYYYQKHVIKHCEKVCKRSGKNLFWSIKNSCEVLNKLKSRDFRASSLSKFDFSALYITLPYNLIKDKLVDLIERTFQREGSLYIAELQLNKASVSDADTSFLDLHLSISDGFVKTKIYNKRDDFDFDIVNFPFLDGDVPRSASYGVYISQLIRFARVSRHVDDSNTRNKVLTAKLLRQGYRYHKLRKVFSKFYWRHFDLVSKYSVGLKSLLLQGLSEPEFYGDLVY